MKPKYAVSIEFQKCGYVHFDIARMMETSNDLWGGCLEKGADLDAPLPCMWEGDEKITPVYLDDETKAAILAKWAE